MKDRISKEEILKWLAKIKNELKLVESADEKGVDFLKNVQAYVNDCEHWLNEGDYVKSWEVISFAWGLLEAGIDLGVLKK